jgi:hypothetical protein
MGSRIRLVVLAAAVVMLVCGCATTRTERAPVDRWPHEGRWLPYER